MKEIPRISEAEWVVMKVFWSRQVPSAANEIVGALACSTDWNPRTIKTLISRLVKKGALGYQEDGRTYYYYPLVNEDECIKAESRSFLRRVYGGALKPMLVNFLREEKLSSEEIEELKRILDERKE
ncbi:MAG: BlaI family transcriptional regulator, penicillinase repressor [Clostridia bacterium]|nr:BlaI family transcriptional regulator, penicillinase repressor [Clostridia bacterium]